MDGMMVAGMEDEGWMDGYDGIPMGLGWVGEWFW